MMRAILMKRRFNILRSIFLLCALLVIFTTHGAYILIPMDETQKDHLKAYGIAYWVLQQDVEFSLLLNYRG